MEHDELMYFANEREADEWLSFYEGDQDRGEQERKMNTEPDRFGEWERWRDKVQPT